MVNVDFASKVNEIVLKSFKTTGLADTPENRLTVLQNTYTNLTKGGVANDPIMLGILQTIEGMIMDLRRNNTYHQ